MLEYNTMRFGTDVFAIVPPPTVTVRINGKDIPLLCYSSQVTEPALAVRYNDEIYYLSLVDPSNSSASKIRVYIDDTTYAVAKDPTYFDTEDYLVSYLKFDESATKDECGNTWTATGSVSLDTTIKKFGSASLHCQNNGRIVAQNVLDINADKWTFDAWFYSTLDWGTGTHMGFFTFGTVNTVGWNRYGLMQERKKVIIAGSGDSWQITGDFVFNSAVANQWHHLAVVKNGDHVLLFFDGVLVKDHTLTSTIRNGGYFWLGTSMYTAANNESPNVYIDNVRVFDGVALWTSDFTPPTAADYS